METFIQKHRRSVIGQLSGFDRLVLRGTPGPLRYLEGMDRCLGVEGVLLKDFDQFALRKTKEVIEGTEHFAAGRGRPIIWLDSPSVDKDDLVRTVASRDGISSGLICVLKTLEPCSTFQIYRNKETKLVELRQATRRCSFFYHYAFHPTWGLSYARIQTWFPFTIQVYLNGREWLARMLDQEGIAYERADNTFTRVSDLDRAQALLDEQLRVDMRSHLEGVARCVHPRYPRIFDRFEITYEWTTYQSEVATDVMFSDPTALQGIYPGLVRHGIATFGSVDVLRFLGQRHRATKVGSVRKNFVGQVTSDYKHRAEGIRVKHTCNSNSVKVYDKAGSVLRVETTINNPRDFKVVRPKQGGPASEVALRKLRKNIEDLPRVADVSRRSNARYLDALAGLSGDIPLEKLACPLAVPARLNGTRIRALNVYAQDDLNLLRAVIRGEHAISGFRNRDLIAHLHSEPPDEATRRRNRANVTRRIRLLRGHGLVERIPSTHRYQLTPMAREALAPLLAALALDATRVTGAA